MLVPIEHIEKSILFLRGLKGMLDSDLAELYGVATKVLNHAVKRNMDRFLSDFMFQLTAEEKAEVVTNCDHLAKLKSSPVLPSAFTEHGTGRRRVSSGARYWKTIGYEFISSKKNGESLIKLQYIEKREKNPLVWLFYFYKAEADWTLNSFIWHDKVPAAFE